FGLSERSNWSVKVFRMISRSQRVLARGVGRHPLLPMAAPWHQILVRKGQIGDGWFATPAAASYTECTVTKNNLIMLFCAVLVHMAHRRACNDNHTGVCQADTPGVASVA